MINNLITFNLVVNNPNDIFISYSVKDENNVVQQIVIDDKQKIETIMNFIKGL